MKNKTIHKVYNFSPSIHCVWMRLLSIIWKNCWEDINIRCNHQCDMIIDMLKSLKFDYWYSC